MNATANRHDPILAIRRIFRPDSVALIGASETNLVAAGALRNLIGHGYRGRVYPINPRHESLMGVRCYPSLSALPEVPDTAIITVPAREIDKVLEECDAAGIVSAVLPAAGYEGDLKRYRLRVLGPEAVGLVNLVDNYVPRAGANHLPASATRYGPIALLTRSGAIANSVFNRAQASGVGVAYGLNTGREQDLQLWDIVEYLLEDDAVKVIMLTLEGLGDPQRFMTVAAKAMAAGKPIVALELGRSAGGRQAAQSHSGALIGSAEVHAAAFREYNIVDVADFDELWQAAALLARWPPRPVPRAERKIGILALSGGEGIMITDRLGAKGIELVQPVPEFASFLVPDFPEVHSQNPLDPTTRVLSTPERFERLVETWAKSAGFTELLVALPVYSPRFAASRVPPVLAGLKKPGLVANAILSIWEAHGLTEETRGMIMQSGLPYLGSSIDAVRALAHHVDYCDRLHAMASAGVKPGSAAGLPRARASRKPGMDGMVRYSEAFALAADCGLATPAHASIGADEIPRVAEKSAALRLPLIIKANVDSALHKAALGLVERCTTREALEPACARILANARRHGVDASGVMLFEEAVRGCELLLAGKWDAELGPVIVFGAGGSWTEALADAATGFAPLDDSATLRLIESTRIGPGLLKRLGDRRQALCNAIRTVSAWFFAHCDSFATLEFNPISVDDAGNVLALDVRVVREE